ncbi:MAG TPA: 4Fe-4S dicluster domain-containing protein [Bacteroidota bacterium]|nr:4Fe-4S dicluster domain-containing protein [Bacteroidota bacterium]
MTLVRQRNLKNIRVASALAFFCLVTYLLADPWRIVPPRAAEWLLAFQLGPALSKAILYGGTAVAGLAVLALLTLLFGRIYCSAVCPLGTLQDFFIRVAGRFRRLRRYKYRPPMFGLHYGLLLLTLLFLFLGSALIADLTEPYSVYAKITVQTLRPAFVLLVNGAASAAAFLHPGVVDAIPARTVQVPAFLTALGLLTLIAALSFSRGRLFCNTLCPAGALLGIASRISLFRIVIGHDDCNGCGKCERTCKAECIDSPRQQISRAACVTCFDCIGNCPTEAISFRSRFSRRRGEHHPSPAPPSRPEAGHADRRAFLRRMGPPLAAWSLPSLLTWQKSGRKTDSYDAAKSVPVVPPGSQSIARYTSLCTACHLCVSSCPTQVLQPAFLEFGIGGILQPKMDYSISYCNYDCTVCGSVCPTGAIAAMDIASKKLVQIGRASFVRDDCVVVSKKKDCAACSEHCPTKAVSTVPYEGSLMIPSLNNDICIGCGACEHACPVTPRKAIYVAPNTVHQRAQKPPEQHNQSLPQGLKEFPF